MASFAISLKYVKCGFVLELVLRSSFLVKPTLVRAIQMFELYSSLRSPLLTRLPYPDGSSSYHAPKVRDLLSKRQVSGVSEFTSFLDAHGPYDVIIDGANVAFVNHTKRAQTDVDFSVDQIHQIIHVLKYLQPNAKVLTILHASRRYRCNSAEEQAYLEELEAKNELYFAPKDSNDDWFWLWGAVHGREKTVLLTNDLMRDHKFNMGLSKGFGHLVQSRFFGEWTKAHVLRYNFSYDKAKGRNVYAHVHYPLPFSHFTQNVGQHFWMVPIANEERGWLRIRPSPRRGASQSMEVLDYHFRHALPENDERFDEVAENFVTVSLPLPGCRGPSFGGKPGTSPATVVGIQGGKAAALSSTRGAVVVDPRRGGQKGARAAHVLVPSVDVYVPGTNVTGKGVEVTLPQGSPRALNVQVPLEMMR